MTRRTFLVRPLSCAGAMLLLPAVEICYAGKVQVYSAKGVDFSSYKTYEWLPPKILAKSGVIEGDPEFAPVIKAAVNKQLAARGLKEVPSGGDLQVSTLALAESVPQLEAVVFPGYIEMDYSTPIATMGRYNREGTLVVNLIDTRTKKSAWAGLAKETLKNKPGAGKEKIDSAATRIFDKYPVKKTK
jgi:hypothetical protein